MDPESLPRWAWLVLALLVAAVASTVVNAAALFPLGLPAAYQSITTITFMAPVVIYVGVWHDDDRRQYWERSRQHVLGDLVFVASGALLASATVLVVIVDVGLPQLAIDMAAMLAGFVAAWVLFWWRNPDIYREA